MWTLIRIGLVKEFDTISEIPDQEKAGAIRMDTSDLCKLCIFVLLGLELNSSVVPLML